MEKIEELLQKAQNGDEEALKEVIEYYKNDGDEEMVAYFEEKLKKVLETKPVETEVVADNKVNDDNVKKADTISKGNDIVYEKLSVSELKEKINDDSKACKELGERYLKSNQFEKAIELFDSAIEMLKENPEDCDEKDLECLFYCYKDLSDCYKEGSNPRFLNLQNATEVPCNEKLKADAYYLLSCIYLDKNDMSMRDNYFAKAGENSKYYSLLLSVNCQVHGNTVDYEYWLEKAKLLHEDDEYDESSLSKVIEFKEKNRKNELTAADYIQLVCQYYWRPDTFFTSNEFAEIMQTLSNLCLKYNENAECDFDTLELFKTCYYLFCRKKRSPEDYKKIDFSELDKFYLNYFSTNIENIDHDYNIKAYYPYLKDGLKKSKNIDALSRLLETKAVKTDSDFEKEVIADFEEVSSIIKEEQDAIEAERLAQEQEKARKRIQKENEQKVGTLIFSFAVLFAGIYISSTFIHEYGFFGILMLIAIVVLGMKLINDKRKRHETKQIEDSDEKE